MKKSKSNQNPVKTVLVIVVGFGVIFLSFEVKWALYISLIIGFCGIISERLSRFIDLLWMKLAGILSLFVPNIMLSIFFYFFLFPIALLSKIFRTKETLILKNNKQSLWVDKKEKASSSSFEKMW